MLINCNIKVLTCVFSTFQGAAGMQGSAELVKFCFLEIMNEVCLHEMSNVIFSDFYVAV